MPGGSGRGSPSTRTLTGQPGLAHLAGELVEAGEAGLRRQGGPLVGHLAQDAQHAAQLA